MFDDILEKMETAIAVLVGLIHAGHPLCGTASGKDSTCATILMLEAVRRVAATGHTQASHFVSSANTTIENVSLARHIETMLEEIDEYAAARVLDVTTHIATPSLAMQFVVSTIGRGTLVRTPENGVRNGKRTRACATDWKLVPQGRLRAMLERDAVARGDREIVTVLGNRIAESASRGTAMLARAESAVAAVRDSNGALSISPLRDWSTDDVWMMLTLFANDARRPFPCAFSVRSIERLSDLYRAGNGGTCGVVLGEDGQRSACGSRFGCAFCCVSGQRDESMESMIQEPQHAYMAGLNDFRNYLLATQWDLGRRELVGRSLSPAGYVRVAPDVLSYAARMDLLRYLLTLDALEIERAEQHEADLATGCIPDTPENRELCDVQFEMITPAQLVAIDFMLSMHHYAPHAFPAVSAWFEVHRLGRRYRIPQVEPLPKAPIPHHGWFHVGQFDAQAPADGLRDYGAEAWNRYLHPERVSGYAQTTSGDRVVYFEESDQLDVDRAEACTFVTCTFDLEWFMRAQQHHAIDSARFLLNETVLRLPIGMSQRYQEMAVRGQYFARLAERLNLTPAELDAHLVSNAISDAEHAELVAAPQMDLFSLAA
jgi:DNA sulfur modification protein DndC